MRIEPNSQEHRYAARLEWTGQVGPGPMEYATYGRSFRVRVQGKPALIGRARSAPTCGAACSTTLPLETCSPGRAPAGFCLDPSVRVEGHDRAGRERLLRYCARPPFALERLSIETRGRAGGEER